MAGQPASGPHNHARVERAPSNTQTVPRLIICFREGFRLHQTWEQSVYTMCAQCVHSRCIGAQCVHSEKRRGEMSLYIYVMYIFCDYLKYIKQQVSLYSAMNVKIEMIALQNVMFKP